mmetsp:Transcript_25514/g.72882  ORF Transcript_25514/g.72882 Transcript_25514/m.72882 type:complete len:275 (-) Transcript_25514:98-922(-)
MAPPQISAAVSEPGTPSARGGSECVICFEELDVVGGAVELPCDCRVEYCASCWDRALATSFSAQGVARCPSCRSPMKAGYDTTVDKLTFFRAPDNATPEPAVAPVGSEGVGEDWTRQVYNQLRPKQIALIRQFGEQCDSKGETHRQCESLMEMSLRSSCFPRCVCGSHMRYVTIKDRVLQLIHEGPTVPPESLVPIIMEHILQSPPIMCDLCETNVHADGGVWSCENGQRTMLHSAAYDVCEACFSFHASGRYAGTGTAGDGTPLVALSQGTSP